MSQWGANTDDDTKPNFPYLSVRGKGNSAPKLANVVATGGGWAIKWPWGLEPLVAISNLNTKLGVAGVSTITSNANTAELPNVAAQTLSLIVSFNERVLVGIGAGLPKVNAIASGSLANVVLMYDEAASDLTIGKVVFSNVTASFASAVGAAGQTVTANSSSAVDIWDAISDYVTTNSVANGIPAGMSFTWTVVSALPFQGVNLAGANLTNAAAQTLEFTLGFNRAVTVTGNVANLTALAIGLHANLDPYANATVTYVAGASNATHLVFRSTPQNFAALTTNVTFAVNSTSTLTGFTQITDASGNIAANTISTANSQLVVAA